jgi:magnesium transporter
MIRSHRSRSRYVSSFFAKPQPGSAPGMLRANPLHHPSQVFMIGYGPEGYLEQAVENFDDINQFLTTWPVVWVDVIGLGTVEVIEKIGAIFGLDRLSLEDVIDTSHRAKLEYHDNDVFTLLKGGLMTDQFEPEQISIFLKKNAVVTFEEKPGHSFEQVRERIRRGTGKIRLSGTDYLHYALIDEIIDKYFPILDKIHQQLSSLEDEILHAAGNDLIEKIHHAKNDLMLMHRTIWPAVDILTMMMREVSPLITKSTRTYLRDCHDHCLQINDLSQFYRDTATSLMNTFLAYENHKTNGVIKVLTIVSAVFIPLNFIASIYGMNFKHIPELEWEYGYLYALGLMATVAGSLLLYVRRRGWLAHD